MEALLIIVAAIAVIVLFVYIAKEFQAIAEMKGYAERKYFWWTFCIPAVGMMMVLALPDRLGGKQISHAQPNDQLPTL